MTLSFIYLKTNIFNILSRFWWSNNFIGGLSYDQWIMFYNNHCVFCHIQPKGHPKTLEPSSQVGFLITLECPVGLDPLSH